MRRLRRTADGQTASRESGVVDLQPAITHHPSPHHPITRHLRRPWRLPARLPGYLRHPGRGARWPCGRLSRRSRSSLHAGLALRQGASVSGPRLLSGPAAVPAAPRRRQGERRVGPYLLGRRHRRDCGAVAGDHRRARRGGDPPLFLQRHAWAAARRSRQYPSLEPDGRQRSGTLDLRRRCRDRGQDDARRTPRP